MNTFISFNFSGFIKFCAKDMETINMVNSSKNGVEAVEKVANNLTTLARGYVIEKKATVSFSNGTETTLIANEIVKLI